jgi:undecaprenyl diphosphate synthase
MIKHLACIMDGNRRWAKQRGKHSIEGHKEGVETAKRVVQFCLDNNIAYLTLYTFSLENFKRPDIEKNYLFDLIVSQAQWFISTAISDGVRIRFVGDRALFPTSAAAACERIERETAHGNRLTVNVLFCYGGQQEILAGVKSIAQQVKDGALNVSDINIDLFKKHLWLDDTPEPEIIIRTGARNRISNFLLFHAAYSEIYFLDCMWPDLTNDQLQNVITSYIQSERNFGV